MSDEHAMPPAQKPPTTRPRRHRRVVPADRPLTPRQRHFVDKYLECLNGTKAAIAAGYSPKAARAQAAHLLTKDNIQAALEIANAERQRRTGVTAARVLRDIDTAANLEGVRVHRQHRRARAVGRGDEMYWNFCYRSMNRAEIVRLETIADSEVEARKLAAIRLEAEGRPPSAFVWLRPACVARSVDYPDLVAKYGTPEQKRQFAAAAPDGSLPAVH